MVKLLNLKEDFEDQEYFDELEVPTEETLDKLGNDLFNAVADVMFKYRDFDISKETLEDIISHNLDKFYDPNWV